MQAVIFMGVQATGKSSFYKEQFFRTHVRINLDMLKTRNREKKLFETCIDIKQPFVIDNTNPTRKDRERYISILQQSGFEVVGYYFESRIKDAISRNSQRHESEIIPEKGIHGTYAKMELPNFEEGFDKLKYVQIKDDLKFEVQEWKDEV